MAEASSDPSGPRAILITNNLVRDLVGPDLPVEERPRLHVGPAEARRLDGNGHLEEFVARVHEVASRSLRVVHCRDWHPPDDPEFARFGVHCVEGSDGASFVFEGALPGGWRTSPWVHVIHSRRLSMFAEEVLPGLLRYLTHTTDPAEVRWGVCGVTTGIKVTRICEGLASWLGAREIGVASELCASTSIQDHFDALDRLERYVGVRVFDRAAALLAWLEGRSPGEAVDAKRTATRRPRHDAPRTLEGPVDEVDRPVLTELLAGTTAVRARPLGGGFSGARVYLCEREGSRGERLAPVVAKLDARETITVERRGHALARERLGPVVPEVVGVTYGQDRAGLLYALAGLRRPPLRPLEEVIREAREGDPAGRIPELRAILEDVADILGDLGQGAITETTDPWDLHLYRERYREYAAASLEEVVEAVGGEEVEPDGWRLPGEVPLRSFLPFYDRVLEGNVPREVPLRRGPGHGDLNYANVLVDDVRNVWLIDFHHARRDLHALQDAAKLENDLKMILTPVADGADLRAARDLEEALLLDPTGIDDLGDPPASVADRPAYRLTWELCTVIRTFAAEMAAGPDLEPLLVPLLRYSLHSLSFEQCDGMQKAHALVASDLASRRLGEWAGRA